MTAWVKNYSDADWVFFMQQDGKNYTNGVLDSTRTNPFKNIAGNVGINNYNGSVDNIRFFVMTLEGSQVSQLINAGRTSNYNLLNLTVRNFPVYNSTISTNPDGQGLTWYAGNLYHAVDNDVLVGGTLDPQELVNMTNNGTLNSVRENGQLWWNPFQYYFADNGLVYGFNNTGTGNPTGSGILIIGNLTSNLTSPVFVSSCDASVSGKEIRGFTGNSSTLFVGYDNDLVQEITTNCTVLSSFSTASYGQNSNRGLYSNLTSDGQVSTIWLADKLTTMIYHVNKSGSLISTINTNAWGSDMPYGVTSNGSTFWFSDNNDNVIYYFENIQLGYIPLIEGTGNPTDYSPYDQLSVTNTGATWNSSSGSTTNYFNVTLVNLSAGSYPYHFWSYGNGSSANYNQTASQTYTISSGESSTSNASIIFHSPSPTINSALPSSSYNISANITTTGILQYLNYSVNNVMYSLFDKSYLIVYYNFDNNSADTPQLSSDVSTYRNNGSIINGAFYNSSGRYKGGMTFDGYNDYINFANVSDNINISGTRPYSYCMWLNPQKGYNFGTALYMAVESNRNGIHVKQDHFKNSTLVYRMTNSAFGNEYNSADNSIPQNAWSQLCFSYNSSHGYLYINGQLVESSADTNSLIADAGMEYELGGYSGATSVSFNGTLDEFQLWNVSKSATEIDQLYRSQLTKFNNTLYTLSYFNTASSGTTTFNISVNDTTSYTSNFTNFTYSAPAIPPTQFKINKTQVKGTLLEGTYGVNTHGRHFSAWTTIDANNDGTRESADNYTYHQLRFNSSGLTGVRADWDTTQSTGLSPNAGLTGTIQTVDQQCSQGHKVFLAMFPSAPSYLWNTTYNCGGGDNTCLPMMNITYDQFINNSLLNITNNHEYADCITVGIGNEPEFSGFFLSGLSASDVNYAIRSREYVRWYNYVYPRIKGFNASIKVSAPSWTADDNRGNFLRQNFFANATEIDVCSYHAYQDQDPADNHYRDRLTNSLGNELMTDLATYGRTCNEIVLEEFGIYNTTLSNNSNYFRTGRYEVYDGMAYLLDDIWVGKSKLYWYQWSDRYEYGVYYPEYQRFFNLVTPPELSNTPNGNESVFYYLLKNMAHTHPDGNSPLNLSIEPTNFTIIVSKNASNYYGISVGFNRTTNESIALNVTDMNITTLTDYETGDVYTASNGLINLGEFVFEDIQIIMEL